MDRGGAFSTNWIHALLLLKNYDHLRLMWCLKAILIYHILRIFTRSTQEIHLLWWGFITLLGAGKISPSHNKCVEVREWLIQNYPEVTKISHEYMLSLRSDNRRDAVHSCVPGWGDWVVMQLLHIVMKFESMTNRYINGFGSGWSFFPLLKKMVGWLYTKSKHHLYLSNITFLINVSLQVGRVWRESWRKYDR